MSVKWGTKILLTSTILLFGLAGIAKAGFGISPPYVSNGNLTQGSHIEQKINLVRSEPVDDWKIDISINVPGAEKWFTIDRGTSFVMPKGQTIVPLIISVDVPSGANFGIYKGNLRVVTNPINTSGGGNVSINYGGQIDVNLGVNKLKFFDFKIHGTKVGDLEEGFKWLWWFIPGKIQFGMNLENLGNIKGSPTKVHLDIYDAMKQNMVESVETTHIPSIDSFQTKEVTVVLKTKLKAGSYWANYKVYKGDQVADGGEGEMHLSILPSGTLGQNKITLSDVPLAAWTLLLIGILAVASLVYFGIKFSRKSIKVRALK